MAKRSMLQCIQRVNLLLTMLPTTRSMKFVPIQCSLKQARTGFFVDPFHSVVQCYHAKIGMVYQSVCNGIGAKISEVSGSWFKDVSGWSDGSPRIACTRIGSKWDKNKEYRTSTYIIN
jgi:hypothetical protein